MDQKTWEIVVLYALGVLVFFLIRAIVLWYFKLYSIDNHLKKTNEILEKMYKESVDSAAALHQICTNSESKKENDKPFQHVFE